MTLNANTRAWIYGIAVAIVPILVAYGLLTATQAPLWLALAGAILSAGPNALALRNVTPDEVAEDADDLPDGGLTEVDED